MRSPGPSGDVDPPDPSRSCPVVGTPPKVHVVQISKGLAPPSQNHHISLSHFWWKGILQSHGTLSHFFLEWEALKTNQNRVAPAGLGGQDVSPAAAGSLNFFLGFRISAGLSRRESLGTSYFSMNSRNRLTNGQRNDPQNRQNPFGFCLGTMGKGGQRPEKVCPSVPFLRVISGTSSWCLMDWAMVWLALSRLGTLSRLLK